MSDPAKILFVDDEKNVLRALERVFFDDDYEILSAGSADEALEILSNVSTVQVVVSDYRMPRMNGVELLRTVKASWPETVRVIVSGYADTAAIISAINDGQVYRFIPKPWNDTDLKMTIASAVEQSRRQRKEIQYAESMQNKIDALERENSFLVRCVAASNHGMDPREVLEHLPAGVVVMNKKTNKVTCNQEARSLLMTHAENGKRDDNHLQIPQTLLEFLNNDPDTWSKEKSLVFGDVPVIVRAAVTESRNCEQQVLAVLMRRETTND